MRAGERIEIRNRDFRGQSDFEEEAESETEESETSERERRTESKKHHILFSRRRKIYSAILQEAAGAESDLTSLTLQPISIPSGSF